MLSYIGRDAPNTFAILPYYDYNRALILRYHCLGPRTRRGRSLGGDDSGDSSNQKREEAVNARLLREVYLGEEEEEETFLIKERWRKGRENTVIYTY